MERQAGGGGRIGAVWRLLRDAVAAWSDDRAASMGAALAFYTLFSVAPLLLIVVSVAGLVFGEDAARGEIMAQVSGMVGEQSARTIESLMQRLNRPEAGAIGTLIGVGTLLVGATTVFGELRAAMDRIWETPTQPPRGVLELLRTRLLSLGMVLGIGFLLMVSLIFSAALAALGKWWGPWLGQIALLGQLLDWTLSFALMVAIFAMIYKWMPHVRLAWGDVGIGAALTALLFVAGKWAIGLYIGRSSVASPFGAAGSLVVLLLWVYYSAQIFLLGAEFTWVYAKRYGSLQQAPAETAPPPPPSPPASGLAA